MSVLSDSEIKKQIKRGNITISPFNEKFLKATSYDLHLDRVLYRMKSYGKTAEKIIIPEEGFELSPFEFYLGSTIERTWTEKYLPVLNGKSSVARLGTFPHFVAGQGDPGFNGHWTLEIMTAKSMKVYYGMPFCQILFYTIKGKVNSVYNSYNSNYHNQPPRPVESKLYENLHEHLTYFPYE